MSAIVKKKVKTSEVKKKINFFGYSMTQGLGEDTVDINPVDVFELINNLPYQLDNEDIGRYLVDPLDETRETLLLSYQTDDNKILGKVAHVRRGARPSVEKKGTGEVRSIKELTPDDGIVETTHFVLYPSDRVIAIEYNHHGPRAKTIAVYLETKAKDIINNVELKSVTNREFQRRLNQVDPSGIRILQMRIPISRSEQVRSIDSDIFEAMKSAEKIGQSEEIEIILRPKKRSRATIDVLGRLKNIVEKIMQDNSEPSEIFTGLKIGGLDAETGRSKEFDLLEEHLVSLVHLVRENSMREIDSDDMFKKIDHAFRSKREEILETLTR